MNSEIVKTTGHRQDTESVELMPPVDIAEDSENFTMVFEIPGANAGSVKVEVENGVLNVEAASTLRRGTHPVVFKRAFRLSRAVDIAKVSAETRDGVLYLTLPKAEHVKSFRVPVA